MKPLIGIMVNYDYREDVGKISDQGMEGQVGDGGGIVPGLNLILHGGILAAGSDHVRILIHNFTELS